MGRISVKFHVKLRIERIDKIAATGTCVLVWERAGVASSTQHATSPVTIDSSSCTADFSKMPPLACDVTLFKSKPSDTMFQPKGVKLSLRSSRADGTALGKTSFNIADYASGSDAFVSISANLNGGAVLIGKLSCTALSSDENDDDMSSASGEDPLPEARASDAGSSVTEEGSPTWLLRNKFKARMNSQGLSWGKKRFADTEQNQAGRGRGGNDEARAKLERVTQENEELRKQLEDVGNEGKIKAANDALRKKINELKARREKNPLPMEVVRELKEAKMALAMMSMEKEEMLMELNRKK